MKTLLLTLCAIAALSTTCFAGQFQDTIDDIDSQLREMNDRAFWADMDDYVSHLSPSETLEFVREVYRNTSLPWARDFLIQYGTDTDRASFEIEKQTPQNYQHWIEQQKANLRSPNAFVRKQAKENLRGIR